MSNESMANYITDTPSDIAELLARNKELERKLDLAVEGLERLSLTGDGTHGSKKASFYDCLPTLQIEFDERLEFCRECLDLIKGKE